MLIFKLAKEVVNVFSLSHKIMGFQQSFYKLMTLFQICPIQTQKCFADIFMLDRAFTNISHKNHFFLLSWRKNFYSLHTPRENREYHVFCLDTKTFFIEWNLLSSLYRIREKTKFNLKLNVHNCILPYLYIKSRV